MLTSTGFVRVDTLSEWDEATDAINGNELLGSVIKVASPEEAAAVASDVIPISFDLLFGRPLVDCRIRSRNMPDLAVAAAKITIKNSNDRDLDIAHAKLRRKLLYFNGELADLHYDGIDLSGSINNLALFAGNTTAHLLRVESLDEQEVDGVVKEYGQESEVFGKKTWIINPEHQAEFTKIPIGLGDMFAFSGNGSTKFGRFPVLHYIEPVQEGRVAVSVTADSFRRWL